MFANVWNSPLMLLLAGREKVHLSEIVPSQVDPGLPSPRQHSQSGADVIWESRNPFFWVKIPLTFLDGSWMIGRVEKGQSYSYVLTRTTCKPPPKIFKICQRSNRRTPFAGLGNFGIFDFMPV